MSRETEEVTVDVDHVLSQLLLFETYVINSFGLKEVPALVTAFGAEGLTHLLNAGALRFHAFRLFAGNLDRHPTGADEGTMRYALEFDGSSPSVPGFYEITNTVISTPQEAFREYLAVVDALDRIPAKKRNKLWTAVRDSLVEVPDGFGEPSTEQTHTDLDRRPEALAPYVAREVTRRTGVDVDTSDVSIRVEREGEIAVFVEANLTARFGLSPEASHQIIGNALLALDRLNVRLELMRTCRAVSGLRDDELELFDDKVDFSRR